MLRVLTLKGFEEERLTGLQRCQLGQLQVLLGPAGSYVQFVVPAA